MPKKLDLFFKIFILIIKILGTLLLHYHSSKEVSRSRSKNNIKKKIVSPFETISSWFLKWNLKFALFPPYCVLSRRVGEKHNYVKFILDMSLEPLSHYSVTFMSTIENIISWFFYGKNTTESEMNDTELRTTSGISGSNNLNGEPVYKLH